MSVLSTNTFLRHFKGNLYQVLTIAKDTETEKDVVVYQSLYTPYQIWVRPLEMFFTPVPEDRYNPTGQKLRFVPWDMEKQVPVEI